ncbi:ATP-dependent DNA ligase [Candidatus Woesearchaeota archaeon]|nr:ATP-dependent DNA ligase [Candidatus Woesearchaeota archaeon]
MDYREVVSVYEELDKTTKRLEKTRILSDFLKKVPKNDLQEIIYLMEGRIFPQKDERKIGFSFRYMIKAISVSSGESFEKIEKLFNKKGDLGLVAEEVMKNKKQKTLHSKKLIVKDVVDNIRKLATLEGKGTVDKKVGLVTELLGNGDNLEDKYVVKTVLENLRVGVSEGIVRDAIASAFNVSSDEVEKAGDYTADYGEVAVLAKDKKLKKVGLKPGRPFKLMLALPAENPEAIFKDLGKLVQFEYKLDGFRMTIHFDGKNYNLFTRRLENVTMQFPDVISIVKKHVKGKSYIIDCEAVGYDVKSKKYLPFQNISQRIKRKYHIEEMAKKFPVELNVFDVIYHNGKNLMEKSLRERREILEGMIKEEKREIVLTKKLITDDGKEVQKFFNNALENSMEGLMAKNYEGPYTPGRYVKGWMKLKNVLEPLDVAIVKAYWGEGKRANMLTSYGVAISKDGDLKEIGKVSTGIKEKDAPLTYWKMTQLLKPLILKTKGKEVEVKPKIVIEIAYEEIQKSPTSSSGWSTRFPRCLRLREDKSVKEISTIEDVKRIHDLQKKK